MTTVRRAFLFLALVLALPAFPADDFRVPDVVNIEELAKELKIDSYKGKKFGRKIKLAVFDNGFRGVRKEIGKGLPPACPAAGSCTQGDLKAIDNADAQPHGTQMSKLAYQLIKRSGADASVEFHLFDTNGFENLEKAVNEIATGQFDVVLYSQVWEWGGNFDGRGFVNALVSKALSSGVIWLNAAGDYGRTTRVAPVAVKDGFVVFKKDGRESDGITLVCDQPTCKLSATLSWNDFKDDKSVGTDKDLDLALLDAKNTLLPFGKHYSGNKRQAIKPPDTEEYSYFPREFIESDATGENGPKPLTKGTYKLRVKAVSSNFDANRDVLRLTVLDGQGIEVKDREVDETLLIPADNPGVIAIGAYDTASSGQSKRLGLPQVHLPSVIRLNDGSIPYSTSNSASIAAAVTVLALGTGTEKTVAAVTAKLKEISKAPQKNPVLDQRPTGPPVAGGAPGAGVPKLTPPPSGSARLEGYDPKCRRLDPRRYLSVAEAVANGGSVFWYRGRVVVSVNYDFLEDYARSARPNERIFIGADGQVHAVPRGVRDSRLPADYIEVISGGIAMCL